MGAQRLALVTGANRGIGLEVARQLAKAGLRVVLTSRNAERGVRATRELAAAGLAVDFHTLDVADPASVATLRADVERDYGGVDVLVNNAGVQLDSRDDDETGVLTVRSDTVDTTMRVNLHGPWWLCQAFVPGMVRRKYGRVVNISSGMGQLSEMEAGFAAYRVSKAALNALTATLAAELVGNNVLVNAVCPGWVRTDMGGPQAPRALAEGASGVVWAACLPDGGPSGGLFRDGKPIPW